MEFFITLFCCKHSRHANDTSTTKNTHLKFTKEDNYLCMIWFHARYLTSPSKTISLAILSTIDVICVTTSLSKCYIPTPSSIHSLSRSIKKRYTVDIHEVMRNNRWLSCARWLILINKWNRKSLYYRPPCLSCSIALYFDGFLPNFTQNFHLHSYSHVMW